ncbi:MAG: EamA-like transporter family protein [Acidobacteria bacterium OLB17]|nr:MAG: EamA-like transporter family protein [Acidobacteria bacterium OLB17]
MVFGVLLWSTGGLFIKITTLDPYQLTFFRSFLAGLTVLIFTYRRGLKLTFVGALASVAYALLLFLFVWATKHTTSANAIFLQYTAPIYILVLSPFIIGEKFRLADLLTVILCIGGMSLFFVGKLEPSDYSGNLAALASGVFYGLYIMLLKHPKASGSAVSQPSLPPSAASQDDLEVPAPPAGNPVVTVIYGNFLLAAVMLPSGISAIPVMTVGDALAAAFLGVIQIGIAYMLFIKGVYGGTRPLDASIIGFIEPLLNPVWVFLFVGERPSNWAILGGLVIIATVVIHTVLQYKRPNVPSVSHSG